MQDVKGCLARKRFFSSSSLFSAFLLHSTAACVYRDGDLRGLDGGFGERCLHGQDALGGE